MWRVILGGGNHIKAPQCTTLACGECMVTTLQCSQLDIITQNHGNQIKHTAVWKSMKMCETVEHLLSV